MEHRSLYEQTNQSPRQLAYAGFWIRFFAHLVDGIILSLISGVLTYAIGTPSPSAGWSSLAYEPGSFLTLLVVCGYYVYFETSAKQATPGKQLFDLKVVKQDGTKITAGTSIGRYFSKILSAVIMLLGYIMVAFDGKKRALHDRIVGTYVIKIK